MGFATQEREKKQRTPTSERKKTLSAGTDQKEGSRAALQSRTEGGGETREGGTRLLNANAQGGLVSTRRDKTGETVLEFSRGGSSLIGGVLRKKRRIQGSSRKEKEMEAAWRLGAKRSGRKGLI